jgi:hypothetical protein
MEDLLEKQKAVKESNEQPLYHQRVIEQVESILNKEVED